MCGEHNAIAANSLNQSGSSPHVRGALGSTCSVKNPEGIIPACAGSTSREWSLRSRRRDHPRMCGEHFVPSCNIMKCAGSSPHVRGARGHAGRLSGHQRDHPRMCGEHRHWRAHRSTARGSSPHVRGAHFENSIIPRKRKDNWLFFIQFRFENFLAFRYLLALLHPFLGVPTKDPSFASLGRLINCNPSQSTGDQSAPYTLKAICCSFLAE